MHFKIILWPYKEKYLLRKLICSVLVLPKTPGDTMLVLRY